MLKSNPGHGSAEPRRISESPTGESETDKPETGEPEAGAQTAAPAGAAVPGIFTSPFKAILTGDKRDQRESAIRSAHRMRMKEYFSRAKVAI